jgi:serine/threonine protein kinase
MKPEQQDPLIGMTLGGCRIQALLGRGGMGTVYRAHHLALDKTVALKVLAGHLESDAEFVERFQREARAAAKVEHPNVIHVLNVAEEKSQHFIILQYIDGENLEQLLDRSGKLDLQTATRIARDAASGLEALHAQGIVHRDIKPANIMLTKDGSVKITDFGLARNLKASSSFTTVSGAFMGTPGFIAPEQVDGPAVDARADLYSLGVVYYMALSNELPFNALTAMEMATQRVTLDPIPLESRVPGVDARAAAIVRRLLQKDPGARFADAGQVRAALEEIVLPPPGPAAPPPPPRPKTVAPRPAPRPATPQEPEEIPEVEIHGRRRPPPAPVPVAADDSVPEISAGPKKRIIQGAPIVPREIEASVPLPSRGAPKTRPLRAEDYPSNPALRHEPPKTAVVRLPDPKPAPPPAQWKHVPPPKREKSLLRSLAYWALVLGGCGAFFAVGALGVPTREEGFLASLPRPFLHQDGGTLIRYGLTAAGIGLLVAAFLANRKQIRATALPGPAVMIPLFAALFFYASGLSAPAQGQAEELVISGARGTLQAMVHPSNLAFLALWGLLAGLTFGMSGKEDFDPSIGAILVVGALVATLAFGAEGDVAAIVARVKDRPMTLAIPVVGLLVAFGGLYLAFAERAGTTRKVAGIVVVLGALATEYVGGLPKPAVQELGRPVSGLLPALGHHGIALILGVMLLSWGAWILHRMVVTNFGKSR